MSTDKNQAEIIEGEMIKGNNEDDFKQRVANFQQEFQALCIKYNCQIVVVPEFVGTNHGSFEIALSQSIGELPKKS